MIEESSDCHSPETNLNIYFISRDELALLVGHDETWEMGIAVRLRDAAQLRYVSGKRSRFECGTEGASHVGCRSRASMIKRPRSRPLTSARFFYLGPHMRYAMQLDVSLIFIRRRKEKSSLVGRILKSDYYHRYRRIATRSSSPRSRSQESSSPIASIGPSPVASFMTALESAKEEPNTDSAFVGTTAKTKTACCAPSPTTTSIIENSGLPVVSAVPQSSAAITREQQITNLDIPLTNDLDPDTFQLSIDANVAQTNAWLRARRFQSFQATFASFSAQDILRLSRDDLIQICGLADGIRLFNALHSKAPTPKLTLYFAIEGRTVSPWRVIYLENLNSALLAAKLIATLNLPQDRLHSVLIQGPQGVHVLVSNELVANIKDESMYLVETIKDCASERYKLLLKPSSPR